MPLTNLRIAFLLVLLALSACGSPADAPQAPTGLTVTPEAGKITLRWQDNSDDETGFTVYRREVSEAAPVDVLELRTTQAKAFEELGKVAANITQFEDTTPLPSTFYRYRVAANNENGASPFAVTEGDAPVSVRNSAPSAASQTVGVPEDTPVTITLVGSDPDGDPLTLAVVDVPSKGTLSEIDPDTNEVVYTPNPDETGTDTFSFSASDGTATSAPATVTVRLKVVNDAPSADDQSLKTFEDTPVTVTLTGSDAEGDTLSFKIVDRPRKGSLGELDEGTGDVVYTPAEDFNGEDTFAFTVSDGRATSAEATVTLSVGGVNDLPTATAQAVSTEEDTPVAITLTGSDAEEDALSYTVTTPPAHGTLSGEAPSLRYTPNLNFSGADTFEFTVSDGQTSSDPATVTLSIGEVNDVPTADAQEASTPEDTPVTLTLTGSDPEGDTLAFAVVDRPGKGTLGEIDQATGAVVYTPTLNETGTDTFSFTVADDSATSVPATVTVNLGVVNDAPTAAAQTLTTNEDVALNIILSASDPDDDPLTYSVVSDPASGVLSGEAPDLTYTPNPNFNGVDTFSFKVNDALDDSEVVDVEITVEAVNDAPVAAAQTLTTDEDVPVSVTLSGSDIEGDALSYNITRLPAKGRLLGTAPDLSYRPDPNFNGDDAFAFTVSDGGKVSDPVTVEVVVASVNDVPTAAAQTLTTDEDVALDITLRASDPDDDPLTYSVVSDPASGMLSGEAPDLTYTPDTNFGGKDTFEFKVSDSFGSSDVVSVSLRVMAVNDAPEITEGEAVTAAISEDGNPTPFALSLSAADVDSNTLTWDINAPASSGSASVAEDGTVSYSPEADFNGDDSFEVAVSDGELSDTLTVNVEVAPVNDAPRASIPDTTVDEDSPFSLDATSYFSDVEGDAMTYSVSSPAWLSLEGNNLVGTPSNAEVGTVDITLTATDSNNAAGSATFSLTVENTNDAPRLTSSPRATAMSGRDYVHTLTTHDFDAADSLNITAPTLPGWLTLDDSGDGHATLSGTPAPEDAGVHAVTLHVTDAAGERDEQSFTVTVTTVDAVSGGLYHNLALKSDGTVIAWGNNSSGQSNVPAGLSDVQAVAAGDHHSLALKSDGTVVAWGNNGYGQRSVPTGLSGVEAIAAGGYHSLALKSDGTVIAWGNNSSGQSNVPAGLSDVQAIAAGSSHNLALKADGTVVAWGWNGAGQNNVPTGLSGVEAIAAGYAHSLALKSDGTVIAWGGNNFAQASVPTDLTDIQTIAAGYQHSLAVKSDGSVVTWGRNSEGQRNVPADLGSVQTVQAGYFHSLALTTDGTVVAWGRNNIGQTTLPAGLNGVYIEAVTAGGAHNLALQPNGTVVAWGYNNAGQRNVPAGLSSVKAVAAGGDHSLTLKLDGTVVAWGRNDAGQRNVPSGLSSVQAVTAGPYHNLAQKKDGTVVAWGGNGYGQANVPAGLSDVQAIAAGFYHSLALKSDGSVVAWGRNNVSQVDVPTDLTDVQAVAAGAYHSLALKSDGTVIAWGANNYGQISVPAGLSDVQAIAAGFYHNLALKEDGTVVAWGYNNAGQRSVPAGLSDVQAIAAGFYHSLALKEDGTVVAWGGNNVGQRNVPATFRGTP